MQKFILCILLMFISCSNDTLSIGTSSLSSNNTLSQSESLIYDNYRFSPNKQNISADLSQSKINTHYDLCITSCISKPLRIAIVPMNASSATTINEIKNAITMLKFSTTYSKYEINIVEGTAFVAQSLIAIEPDIIVGPFNEKDLLNLQRQMYANKMQAPIVSLASQSALGANVYNFGYKADANIVTIMNYAKQMNYKNFVMFAPNNEIGGNSYKIFSEIAKKNKQEISRVEFYEEDLYDIAKYINRLKSASIQTYYIDVNTGKMQKDDFNFTSKIKSIENGIATHESGKRFYKKYKIIDAIILDAPSKDFKKIYEAIALEESLKSIPLIGSQRIVDGIIETTTNEEKTADMEVLFPANWEQYRNYYEVYKNTFNNSPSRLSTTVYETLHYILKVNQSKPIDNIAGMTLGNTTLDGINGKITSIPDNRTIQRTIEINSFKNGTVNTINKVQDNYQ